MPIDASIYEAIRALITASRLQGRATLIGGQAIRDWHASQEHALDGAGIAIPATRSTTDVDVHLAIEEEDRDLLRLAITQAWDPNPSLESEDERVYSYRWRNDPTVTLDLVWMTSPQQPSRMKTLVNISHGPSIAAVRVLPPWILTCHLAERCFTPAFARLGIHRLTRLGLAASKLQAVHTAVAEHIAADAQARLPAAWVERLLKDLQDLELLLAPRPWVAPLWETRYQLQAQEINAHWTSLYEQLRLQTRPPSMPVLAHQRLMQAVLPLLPVRFT